MADDEQLTRAEFYATYPAVHELQAASKFFLTYLDLYRGRRDGCTLETMAPFLERLNRVVDRDGQRIDRFDKQFCSNQDIREGYRYILRRFAEDGRLARDVLQGQTDHLNRLMEKVGRDVLGLKGNIRFFSAVRHIASDVDGSLPSDAIGSILPPELRDSENTCAGPGTGLDKIIEPPPGTILSQAMTPQEIGIKLDLSRDTVVRHIKAGKLPAVRLSDRRYQIPVDLLPSKQD